MNADLPSVAWNNIGENNGVCFFDMVSSSLIKLWF